MIAFVHYKRFILLFAMLALISWGFIAFHVYHEEKNEAKFYSLFPIWFHDRMNCSSSSKDDRELLSILDPTLINEIDSANKSFHQLSILEQSGKLSVADLMKYKKNDWRVLGRHENKIVGSCVVDGFIFNKRTKMLEYCEKYVKVRLLPADILSLKGQIFSTSKGELLLRDFKNNLQKSSSLSKFIREMEMSSANKLRHLALAKNSFGELPASQFEGYDEEELNKAKNKYMMDMYLEHLCAE